MAFFALVVCLSLGLVAANPHPHPYPHPHGWGSGFGSGASGFGDGAGLVVAGGSGAGAGAGGAAGFAPIIIEQVAPTPVTLGLPLSPNVIDHQSAPYEINYFGTPYVVKHKQGAALNVYTQTPVVVDTYAEPKIQEQCAEPAVIVEEVGPCFPVQEPCY